MAEPHSIPSNINTSTSEISVDNSDNIYITAILSQTDLTIDDSSLSSIGPVSLSSPLICKSVIPTAVGSIAYYIQ